MGKKGQKKERKGMAEEGQGEVVSSEALQEQLRNSKESDRRNILTSTFICIHYPSTTNEEYTNELDEIDLENFLNTLAEVALAIASRKLRPEPVEGLASHRQQGGEVG